MDLRPKKRPRFKISHAVPPKKKRAKKSLQPLDGDAARVPKQKKRGAQ